MGVKRMTKAEAITELVRIWHSPHLDLSLKAGLAEVIETLKEKNQSDSLVRDDAENCKESESKLDLISRQDAIDVLEERLRANGYSNTALVSELNRSIGYLMRLPSAEPKTGEWVKRQTIGDVSFAYCSECGEPILHGRTSPLWNFCPNCGTKMYKDGEDE